jgi:hypothetical protein
LRRSDEVYAEPVVQHILIAIDDNVPIALVRDRWRTASAAADSVPVRGE